jgi:hypothetical protein
VDDKDLRQATQKIEAYHQELVTPVVTPKILTMPFANKKGVKYVTQPIDFLLFGGSAWESNPPDSFWPSHRI